MVDLDDIMNVGAEDAAAEKVYVELNELGNKGFLERREFSMSCATSNWSDDVYDSIIRNLSLLVDSTTGHLFIDDKRVIRKKYILIKRQARLSNISNILRLVGSDDDDMILIETADGGKFVSMWLFKLLFCAYSSIYIDVRRIQNNISFNTLLYIYKSMAVPELEMQCTSEKLIYELMRFNFGAFVAVKELTTESNFGAIYHFYNKERVGRISYSNVKRIRYNGSLHLERIANAQEFGYGRHRVFVWTDCYIAVGKDTRYKEIVAVFTNKYDRYMRELCGVIRTRADIKTDLEEIQRGYSNRISRFVDELISAGVKVSQEQLMVIIK